MNQRNLILLGLAVSSMLMLNWFQSNKEIESQDSLLLPRLKENLALLTRVEIKSSSNLFTLLKEEGGWVLAEKDAYPVDFQGLSILLKGLAGARLIEKKTSKPENFGSLKLMDISNEDSESILVTGFAPDYEFAVLVGKQALGREGQFIRMSGHNQAWLIDEEFEISGDVTTWLDPIIINVDSEQVVRVEQFDPQGSLQFAIERSAGIEAQDGEPVFTLSDIPSGSSLKYPSITDELARSLVNVRFTDVSLHQPSRWQSPARMQFSLVDGGAIAVAAEKIDGTNWLHLTVSDTSEGKENTASWDYEVSSYVFEDYTKELDDLLESESE